MKITREITQKLGHSGWREEALGYYTSGKKLKPLCGWAFFVRRTPLTNMGISPGDIATKSPDGDSENSQPTRVSARGQIPVWEAQKEGLTPTPDPSIRNPKVDEIKSLALLRSGRESLVLGFDTEWGSDGRVLSLQFAAIDGNDLVEMVFLSQGGLFLSLEIALGRCLEHLGMTSLDERPYLRYKYCTNFQKNGRPVEIVTQSCGEARQKSRYIWKNGTFQSELIENQPDKHKRRALRKWAWFHRYHEFPEDSRHNVTLVCHCGNADLRFLGEDNGISILRYCSSVQGGVVTLTRPIPVAASAVMSSTVGHKRVLPLLLNIRDTMAQAPASGKSLEALGESIGIPKISIPSDTKARMETFLKGHPSEFLEYASRDAVVTLLYATSLYGANREMAVTLTSVAAHAAKDAISSSLGIETEADFQKKFRGLQKVRHGLKAIPNRSCFIESSSLEPISDHANTIQSYASKAYHGGYNGSSLLGSFRGTVTYDFDLKNAYPTAMCLVPDINWMNPIASAIRDRELSLSDFRSEGGNPSGDAAPLFLMYGSFEFPKEVLYPCLPLAHDGSLIFPRTSQGVDGAYFCGPEVVLALKLGAHVHCETGYFLNPLLNADGTRSYSLRASVKQLVEDREKAKCLFGEGSLPEQTLKTMVNSIYGKTAQNVVEKHSWSAYYQHMECIGASCITNPVSAALTTSIVRALLLAAQNQVVKSGYRCYSVTTDGGIFDCPLEVLAHLDLYGLRACSEEARLFLTNGRSASLWSIKHAQDDLVNFCRRGNVSLYTKEQPFLLDGHAYPGVCAHNSCKSPYPSDSFADRRWLMQQVLSRTGKVPYTSKEWTSFHDQTYQKKVVPFAVKEVTRSISLDFDMARKPVRDSLENVHARVGGMAFEIANFSTQPFESIEEYTLYRRKKANCPVLRTMSDWDRFFLSLEAKGCTARKKNDAWSILYSCIAGYRLGMWDIKKLTNDTSLSVQQKCDWINEHSQNARKFTVNDWKNARKPSRANSVLPQCYVQNKLDELNAAC